MGKFRDPDLRQRTKEFSLRVIKLVRALPREHVAQRLGDQLLRAGTSVGANYRAACRARSAREFIAKMGIVEEEADESAFWMETLSEAEIMPAERMKDLLVEAGELTAIAVASINTARRRRRNERKT